jgi:hypothetical protein
VTGEAQWWIWYSPGFLDGPLQVVSGPLSLYLRDFRLQIDQRSAQIFYLATQVLAGGRMAAAADIGLTQGTPLTAQRGQREDRDDEVDN